MTSPGRVCHPDGMADRELMPIDWLRYLKQRMAEREPGPRLPCSPQGRRVRELRAAVTTSAGF